MKHIPSVRESNTLPSEERIRAAWDPMGGDVQIIDGHLVVLCQRKSVLRMEQGPDGARVTIEPVDGST